MKTLSERKRYNLAEDKVVVSPKSKRVCIKPSVALTSIAKHPEEDSEE